MTLKMLNQYRSLPKEVSDLNKQIKEHKQLLAGHHEVMASMDVYPYIAQTVPLDKISQSDMQETLILLQRQRRRYVRQRKEIERYIASIEDSQLRRIFRLRFVEGLSWDDVTIRIGGDNSADGVKKQVYRHLKFVPNVPKKGATIET